MSSLLERVEAAIHANRLLKPKQPVLVAVSGGVDSMVLLHVLCALARKFSWRLTIAHLNHQLRGRSSDADEDLVVRTAKKLRLPIVVERADIRKIARAEKLSIEMAARRVRHEFLAGTAARLKIHSIALAHHADDQVELFFLRLFRGSGSAGLSGMKWSAPSPAMVRGSAFRRSALSGAANSLKTELQVGLVRPLLGLNKAELKEFARENRIRFREDASNRFLDMRRNRIRHELLPLLRRKYQPALDQTVLRLMTVAGAEAELANQLAAQWLGARKRAAFEGLPLAVQRRCIQLQLFELGLPADYDLVEKLRTCPGCKVTVSPQCRLALSPRGELVLDHPHATRSSAFKGAEKELNLKAEHQTRSGQGSIDFEGVKIHWRIESRRTSARPKARIGREFFDADKLGPKIILRHWQPGDRLQPIGMGTAVKLQDLFVNQKIPRQQRHELVVLTTGDGEVVWVEKLRISERFKLCTETKRRLQWQWKRL